MNTPSPWNPQRVCAWTRLLVPVLLAHCLATIHAADTTAEVKSVAVNGGIQDGKARLVIEAELKGLREDKEKLLFATSLQHTIHATREKLRHAFAVKLDVIQGEPKELPLVIAGEGEIRQVTGEGLQDWSIRQEPSGLRQLILRPKKMDKSMSPLAVTIAAETELKALPRTLTPLTLAPSQPALFNGYLKIEMSPDLEVDPVNPTGLIPLELKYLPQELKVAAVRSEAEPLAFRFLGSSYALPLKLALADPEARRVVLTDFKLASQLSDENATFTLTAKARVRNPRGGVLDLLSGGVALTDLGASPDWKLKYQQGRFLMAFEKPGEFPIQLKFDAAVQSSNSWNVIHFRVAPSSLQPVVFQGLPADTQFQFAGAARPERTGNDFASFLPANGVVNLAWKAARPEAEGKLFYSAEALSQITISSGLMRQVVLLDFKVMQGELNRVVLALRGPGEVTRVQGEQVLAWTVEPVPNSSERRLAVQFNQAQKDQFSLQVHTQMPLGAFPQSVEAIQVRPEGVTRYAGYFRIVNEGAVRLEVVQANGLSQISPEQFPESDATRALFRTQASQRFAFRFSGADFQLRIQADNILPEVAVSEVLTYHLGETELAIEAEMELDIREAPLRELLLRVPKGYATARLNASGLSDYFLRDPADQPDAELRLVYGSPMSGRQLIQLRLERNKPLGETAWTLPKVEVVKAKSVRGHVGVSADAGFRLTPEKTQALTEIPTAFFPKKLAGIQAAFRLSEPGWAATLRLERLPQSIQVDAFHLFSIGEGIAYGSSVMNYLISGAPIATFKVELSSEYYNVEFTGKDIRNWQKTDGGYQVFLHTPVAGAYTLLATYERPFKAQGETLAFTGARPLDAQTEQGHTLVISAYQFQVQAAEVSPGLLPLEPGEVPPEYRLFFDAPILAAYRYASRPFNLRLVLSPLAQGDTLSQVVDRASLSTRISKEGQVITDARYLVKNRGMPHFRLTLPSGAQMWSATVNGVAAVPVTADNANLIPLPQRADPNAVITLDLKVAARSKDPTRVTVAAPIVSAPVLLAEWKMEPDAKHRLVYRTGSLMPAAGIPDASGFAGVAQMFGRRSSGEAWAWLAVMLAMMGLAALAWRWATGEGTYKFSLRHVSGAALGLVACLGAGVAGFSLVDLATHESRVVPAGITLLAPVQQAGSALSVEVANLSDEPSVLAWVWRAWPALLALAIWAFSFLGDHDWFRPLGRSLGWTLLGWAALRWPNGAPGFVVLLAIFLFLHVMVPGLRRLRRLPNKPKPAPTPPSASSPAAPAAASLLWGGLILWNLAHSAVLAAPASVGPPVSQMATALDNQGQVASQAAGLSSVRRELDSDPRAARTPLAESVFQQIRVEDKFAFASATIRWQATNGQTLPLLYEPAVLTRVVYPTNALKLIQAATDSRRGYLAVARESGTFELEAQYQLQVIRKDGESGFGLPTQFGLINRLTVTLAERDVEVYSPQAVSVQRDAKVTGTNTVARLVLSPANDAWIGWKPRSRDVRREKAVFYAEIFQLYAPLAGVIEGAHQVQIRPAQGELNELIFDVPPTSTITDVVDPSATAAAVETKKDGASRLRASLVSLWRFDPDSRKLRVSLALPQSKPFSILIRSQVPGGPLPFEQSVGLLSAPSAAGQLGLLGIATGTEVQLDNVTAEAFSVVNLEDYPGAVLQTLQPQIPGLTLRRAFRYSDPKGLAVLKASPVEPDVRVEAQETLSLGEDRIVLAATASVEITRSGIFRLSFVLPAGLDVEAVSGSALSHWTELKSDAGRVITLHLRGKTEGKQQFMISLAGQGLRSAKGWAVPRLLLREATKQQGQLVIVPEQGMRLQVTTRDGLTQLDPEKSGIRQKGVLVFRLLQSQWNLALDLEQVDAWIQVTSLQHIIVNEAQAKVTANLQYQIENTGLKSLRVLLSTNAESVRVQGDQVSDFLPVPGRVTGAMQEWEIKLHRRVIGKYLLQVSYQARVPENATETRIRGVQAEGVNLQRGFVTVQSGGRLQVRISSVPAALQPSEWQSVPRALRQEIRAETANYTYRLVEPAYELPIQLDRHEAARLLPARVNSLTLSSVISDEGVMLTQVRLDMIPGDKRLLHLTLPARGNFWFAFVNQNGVWPWREKEQILIPLEQQAKTGQAITVEFFYSSQIGLARTRSLDLALLGPKFDLPLENIKWEVFLNEKWQLKDWTGSLQLQEEKTFGQPVAVNLESYLQNEAKLKQEKTQEAEQMLAIGNSALERGDPQQARRAFQNAFGLSTHDDAFNEDARVQLHNLKLQQALVGLNVRQAGAGGEAGGLAAKLRDLRTRKGLGYTQQEAKQIIDSNTEAENSALMRLAERLIQQQDAAVSSPSAIRASIPQQGRLFVFTRAVQVDTWADLTVGLQATAVRAASSGIKLSILAGVFAALAFLAWVARRVLGDPRQRAI